MSISKKTNAILRILINKTILGHIKWDGIEHQQGEYTSFSKTSISDNGFRFYLKYSGGTSTLYQIYFGDEIIVNYHDDLTKDCVDEETYNNIQLLWNSICGIEGNFIQEDVECNALLDKVLGILNQGGGLNELNKMGKK